MKTINKILVIFYLYLYVSYVFFGPDHLYYPKFKVDLLDEKHELKRFIWITYIGLLVIAYYFAFPNYTNFVNAFIFNFIVLISYVKNKSRIEGTIFHMFNLIPVLIYGLYTLDFNKGRYEFNMITLTLILYIVFLEIFKRKLYKKIK